MVHKLSEVTIQCIFDKMDNLRTIWKNWIVSVSRHLEGALLCLIEHSGQLWYYRKARSVLFNLPANFRGYLDNIKRFSHTINTNVSSHSIAFSRSLWMLPYKGITFNYKLMSSSIKVKIIYQNIYSRLTKPFKHPTFFYILTCNNSVHTFI